MHPSNATSHPSPTMNFQLNPTSNAHAPRRRSQPSPIPRPTITLSQTTLLLAHFANLKLSADRIVHSTLSVTLQPPAISLPTPARSRQPRRRRRRNVTVNKLSDADLEAELAARRAARVKERDRYARAIRSEKLSALEGELNRLRQELVRVGRGSGALHGTPPNARWESLPERKTGRMPVPPGTPVPKGPAAPPPMPPPPGGDADPLFVDPETRRREKEERQKRREAKRKEREANRKPLTLAEIIKSAGPDPMKRLKPPGSIAVPDVHEPEDAVGENELKDVREGLKKATADGETKEGEDAKKEGEGEGDETKEAKENGDEGENKEEKGENEDGTEKGGEVEDAATGEEKAVGKDDDEKASEDKREADNETSKHGEDTKPEPKTENVNQVNPNTVETSSQPQAGEQRSTQTKVTPKSPKGTPTISENKQDDEQPASDDKPESDKSPTKITTPSSDNTTKTPPKPPSQAPESANKELKLPNGIDAFAALSNLKLKLPVKSPSADANGNAVDTGSGNSDPSAAGSASDGPAPRPKAPARLSLEEKRRIRRAKKEEGVKME